jgi:hypothetical protein
VICCRREVTCDLLQEGGVPKPWIALSGDDDGVHYLLFPVSEDPENWEYDRQVGTISKHQQNYLCRLITTNRLSFFMGRISPLARHCHHQYQNQDYKILDKFKLNNHSSNFRHYHN